MSQGPFLDEAVSRFRMVKGLGDGALSQVDDAAWTAVPGADGNALAHLVKHVAGNQRSRWRDFLTTDGEKPDRDRDSEFVLGPGDTPAALRARWEEGWGLLFAALAPLRAEDLGRSVTIRGEPHTVLQAVNRQQTHYAYHVGQIVLLARLHAGARWRSLSIPRGKSREYEVDVRGGIYSPGNGAAP